MHELPSRRESITQKLGIVHAGGRASLYITTSNDSSGKLQEVFISVEKDTGVTGIARERVRDRAVIVLVTLMRSKTGS